MDIKLFKMFLAVTNRDLSSINLNGSLKMSDVEIANTKVTNVSRILKDAAKIDIYKKWIDKIRELLKHHAELSVDAVIIKLLQENDLNISDSVACESLTQIFCNLTAHQSDILALVNLARYTVDTPVIFAAIIRVICLRQVSQAEILQSYLFHDYFNYYLCTLSYENNEVKQLFRLLEEFPETRMLAILAGNVQSEERGFTRYTLDGAIDKQNTMSIEKKLYSENITCTNLNLTNLYKLFGIPFLVKLLANWHEFEVNREYRDFLCDLLNCEEVIHNHLPQILTELFDSDTAQQALSELLDSVTLNILIENKNHAILALLPYRHELLNMIENEQLDNYLQLSNRHEVYKITLVMGLVKLAEVMRRSKSSHIDIVLKHLLDTALEVPDVFEDETIIKIIRRHPFAISYCANILRNIEEKLHQSVMEQIQKIDEGFDFIEIEDLWRQCLVKIQALRNVDDFPSSVPPDKIALYTYLAIELYSNNVILDIDKLAKTLNIEPILTEDVSVYERFIVAILTTIDDEFLRQQCTQLLVSKGRSDWRTHLYGGLDLYSSAVRHGNLRLITWLQDQNINPHESLESLIINAANLHQWQVVKYLFEKFTYKTTIINTLLHTMVNNGAGHAISIVWDDKRNLPSLSQIEQSLALAVRKNDLLSLYNITHYFSPPNDNKLASLFMTAVKSEYYEIAQYIADFKTKNTKKLLDLIDDAFIYSVHKNKPDLLKKLIGKCRPNILNKALSIAVRSNLPEIVGHLISTGRNFPSLIISKSLCYAKKRNYELIIEQLSNITKISRKAASSARLTNLINEESCQASNNSPLSIKVAPIPKRSLSLNEMGIFAHAVSPKSADKISSPFVLPCGQILSTG